MPEETIRGLLAGIVDYAGLFPPAGLEMPAAVREFARQRASGDAWMLGRFVVPVGRLDELENTAASFWHSGGVPWRLSVLTPGDPAAARDRIDAFQQAHARSGHALVEAIERPAATPEEIAVGMAAFAGLDAYFELPHQGDLEPLMNALAEHGGRAKIRSGGITADAFPTVAEIARFIVAASSAGVPFKATAGLHHPLRGEYRLTYEDDSPSGTMHGFLNVFLAAAAVKSADMGCQDIEALLEERDPGTIHFVKGAVRWRQYVIATAALRDARTHFATSYGSCSFAEPVSELRGLSIL